MAENKLDNKRIAKNAVMLTVRMLAVTIIGIFTGRVVLQTLGVEDYGTYELVGGIVGISSFLNAAMGASSSRFITFELGKGNMERLKKIFSTSLCIHFFIALIAILVAETVGLWLVNYKLVIPERSIVAANIVYQLSVLSLAVGFTQVPYSAAIMAHEKMNIYAYFEIVNVVVKLLVLYVLMILPAHKLEWYAVMLFLWSTGMAFCYRLYCMRNFEEARCKFKIDKPIAKEMLTYSGYDLYGNLSCTVYLRGFPLVVNMFLGVVANTACGIASTINGTAKGFSWAVSNAFVPQVTKQYASGNLDGMVDVMCKGIKFTVLIFAMICLPFVTETDRVLYIWLGQIPPYASVFVKCVMLVTIIDDMTMSNNRAIHATGNIKWMSLITGNFYIASPFLAYAIMRFGGPACTPYLTNAAMLASVVVIGIVLVYRQIPGFDMKYYLRSVVSTYGVVMLSVFIMYCFKWFVIGNSYPIMSTSLWDSMMVLIVTAIVSVVVMISLSMMFVLTGSERKFVIEKVKSYTDKLPLRRTTVAQ